MFDQRQSAPFVMTWSSRIVWAAAFVVALILYVLTTAPAWILMRNSDSLLAVAAQRFYSPMHHLCQRSEFADSFFLGQWQFWFPILG